MSRQPHSFAVQAACAREAAYRGSSKALHLPAAILLLAFFPAAAYANMGTPLAWATFFHLFLGNLLLGIGEGLVVALVFRLPKLKTMALLVAANYFSAWVGYYFLAAKGVSSLSSRDTLAAFLPMAPEQAWTSFWILLSVAYLLTLLLEFPFIAYAMRRLPRWLPKALAATLLVQTASYALLIGWYAAESKVSLYTEVTIAEASELNPPENVLLYYISAEDGNVYVRWLSEDGAEQVYEVKPGERRASLKLHRDSSEGESWELVLDGKFIRSDIGRIAERADFRIAEAIPEMAGALFSTEPGEPQYLPAPYHGASAFTEAEESPWHVFLHWNEPYLIARNANTGEGFTLGLQTPVVSWPVLKATHLPQDFVLFELNRKWICLLDLETRRLAVLAEGRDPLPVIPQENASPSVASDFRPPAIN